LAVYFIFTIKLKILKIKTMIQKLLNNAVHSVWTSIAGSIAGITEITIGVKTGDTAKIITGVGILLLGLFSKEK
jgi:hypothetical protein